MATLEITLMNWDDIVRKEKRKAFEDGKGKVESFTWGTEGWKVLQQFHKSSEGESYSIKKHYNYYFGVKHYHNPKIEGYIVQR